MVRHFHGPEVARHALSIADPTVEKWGENLVKPKFSSNHRHHHHFSKNGYITSFDKLFFETQKINVAVQNIEKLLE